mgnify:CR=1 FL=1|tara:strand:- start:761 stop:1195 length:435 start_codon:yes stop_codon:yes gene_type:complete
MTDSVSTSAVDNALNSVLGALSSSLVQYTGECGPWTPGEDDAELAALDLFRRRQQLQIARLVSLLGDHGATIEMGRFPSEYTDLHFVSLENLYPRMIANQQDIVETIRKAGSPCHPDEAAASLVKDALAEERRTLTELETLAAD